eukprot:1505021-Rhodomonas_salina.1
MHLWSDFRQVVFPGLNPWLARCAQLRDLTMTAIFIDTDEVVALCNSLAACPCLKTLDLSKNMFERERGVAGRAQRLSEAFSALPALQELCLQRTYLSQAERAEISANLPPRCNQFTQFDLLLHLRIDNAGVQGLVLGHVREFERHLLALHAPQQFLARLANHREVSDAVLPLLRLPSLSVLLLSICALPPRVQRLPLHAEHVLDEREREQCHEGDDCELPLADVERVAPRARVRHSQLHRISDQGRHWQ